MSGLFKYFGIDCTEPVRDPIWKNILLPREFMPIVASEGFTQLSRILQLGPAQLVYPGATHTRRAHSLGVFEMAKRILSSIAEKGLPDGLPAQEARAFLVAALCHDLGHFPYAHSLKELPLAEHEELTALAVNGPLADVVSGAGADPRLVAAIVDGKLPCPPGSAQARLSLYRNLLSGALDPDKLDYLNRDAWACGVPYGIQDVDFILQHIGLDLRGLPGVDERGVMALEGLLFSKYQMYKAVYWHRSVRAATAMIKKAVMDALADGSLLPEELYGLDDAGFHTLMSVRGRDPRGLNERVRKGSLLACCLELPFDATLPFHARLACLRERSAVERDIESALALKGGQAGGQPGALPTVIIDIPEPISFESELPILGTGVSFSSFATVFRPDVVAGFTRSLRVLRVFSDADPASCAGIFRELSGR